MLRRLIGEDIELASNLDADLGAVKADLGQLGQVLMNLVVNARDAMPDGGKITISTYNLPSASDVAVEDPHPPVGDYVALSVSDEGTGIPEDVKPYIFEPFFTTKDVGQGTGLGLATCYGIVNQSGGIIKVDPGEEPGTTIRVYLPRAGQTQSQFHEYVEQEEENMGVESILVVEDEELVRGISTLVLREKGYSVVEASSGEEALKWLREHGSGSVDILVTDMVMPRMTGAELAVQAVADFPDLKVLYVSGYSEEQPAVRGALEGNIPLLRKPFTPAELATKVREVLDSKVPVRAE